MKAEPHSNKSHVSVSQIHVVLVFNDEDMEEGFHYDRAYIRQLLHILKNNSKGTFYNYNPFNKI